MNEQHVVRWEHKRPCGATMDDVVTLFQHGDLDLEQFDRAAVAVQLRYVLPSWRWHDLGLWAAGSGGKTRCRICKVVRNAHADDNDSHLETVASAVAVCSWRDQFSRRVGRLYSLALALCELDRGPGLRWDIFCKNCDSFSFPADLAEKILVTMAARDKPAVKAVCAEIVAAWQHPVRVRTKPTPEQIEEWRAEARSKHAG